MPQDAASLQNLHDIVLPEPPPLWPPAPGIWVLLVIGLAVVTALVVWWWRVRSRNAYRRAGLALLEGTNLIAVETVQAGLLTELVYGVEFRKRADVQQFLEDLRKLNDNNKVALITGHHEVDL